VNVHEPVTRKIRAFRSRIRACLAVEGLSYVALVVAGLASMSLLIDYTQRPGFAGRLFSLVVGLGLIGWALYRTVLSRLARPMDDERIALTVEDCFPELHDRLISSLQFTRMLASGADARSQQSVAMMSAVTADAAAAVAPLKLATTIDHGRVVRAVLLAAAVWAGLAALAAWQPNAAKIWFLRNVALQDVDWPQRTHLAVSYNKVVPRGDALTVTVEATGRLIPASVAIRYKFLDSGRKGRERLGRVGGRGRHRFEAKFKNVVEPLTFRVAGGDAETEWFGVTLVERPAVRTLKLQAVYPRYTNKPNAELDTSESYLDLLAGTTLWVRVIPGKPLRRARLVIDDGVDTIEMMRAQDKASEPWQTRAFWLSEDERSALAADAAAGKCADELWIASLDAARDSSVAVRLIDMGDLEDRSPTRFSIRTIADKPPAVTLRMKGIGQMVVPDATIPLAIKAADDYGVRKLRLKHKLRMGGKAGAEDEDTIDFRLRYGGQEVAHEAEAADYRDDGQENVGRSEEISLRVVTRDELMADLVRRQINQRQDLVRVRDRQRDEVKIELDAAARAGDKLDAGQKARLLAAEQTLRRSAEELKTIADVCDQVLQEMINNKLGDDAERSTLKDAIVAPTRRLGARLVPGLADGVRAATDAAGPAPGERFAKLSAQNDRILEEMDGVLSNMRKLETYRRIVEQVRKVREDQERLLEDIEKAYKKLIESILDGVK